MRKCEIRKLPSAMGEKRQLFCRLLNAEVSVVNVVTYAVCMRRCNVTKRVEHSIHPIYPILLYQKSFS